MWFPLSYFAFPPFVYLGGISFSWFLIVPRFDLFAFLYGFPSTSARFFTWFPSFFGPLFLLFYVFMCFVSFLTISFVPFPETDGISDFVLPPSSALDFPFPGCNSAIGHQ